MLEIWRLLLLPSVRPPGEIEYGQSARTELKMANKLVFTARAMSMRPSTSMPEAHTWFCHSSTWVACSEPVLAIALHSVDGEGGE